MQRDAHLLIVGEPKFVSAATRYDNRAYYAELERIIAAEGSRNSSTFWESELIFLRSWPR